jgi:23S rRNA (uracil1939-C5)-methyltransferase
VRGGDGLALGFHRRGAKEVVAIAECPVLLPALVAKIPVIAEIAALAVERGREARITVVAADNGLDIAIEGVRTPSPRAVEALGRFGADLSIARLTVDGAEIFRNRIPEIGLDGAALLPPAGGFLQAAAQAEEALAEAVIEHVGTERPIADLFCGIGTFSLRLARKAPVTAIDGEQSLIEALQAATRRATGLKPITAKRRDLFANPLAARELDSFGAVVFDPPAAGAKAQAEQIALSKVKRVVAVSCNPATLARDARILVDGGYRVVRVLPVDQFLFSAEIEAVAAFER